MACCPHPSPQRRPTILRPLIAFLLTIIEWAFIASAFATNNNYSRFISPRSVSTFYSKTTNTNDSGIDDDDIKTIYSNDKCAIIFLHGLGDSPDGWSTIAEALPKLSPSLAKLDITYVFPPAQLVAITVNGGEKMPGVWLESRMLLKRDSSSVLL